LLIEVVGRPKAYWLLLGVAHDAKLSDLDEWLRAIWLECCDHLSEFVIGPTRYSSDPSPTFSLRARSQSTHIGVGKVLRPGVAFEHHYDFGSTTVVDLSVVGELIVPLASQAIVLLANNEAPDIPCLRPQDTFVPRSTLGSPVEPSVVRLWQMAVAVVRGILVCRHVVVGEVDNPLTAPSLNPLFLLAIVVAMAALRTHIAVPPSRAGFRCPA
jgi:hypothetical protein